MEDILKIKLNIIRYKDYQLDIKVYNFYLKFSVYLYLVFVFY